MDAILECINNGKSQLKELYLYANKFTDDSMEKFRIGLSRNRTLDRFDLSKSDLTLGIPNSNTKKIS